MFRRMHPDVAKLVEAGRIPKPVGERLTQLAPGNFCIHKSFGAGKVIDWDLPGKKVTIDFEKSAGQTMELQFAFQKTEWIPTDDFRAKKNEQIEELRSLSKSDPIQLIVHLLESHGGSMTGDALEKALCGTVIPEPGFKKWWDANKKALRESRLAVIPQKRTEAIVLRTGDRTPAQALVADFEAARDIKGMITAASWPSLTSIWSPMRQRMSSSRSPAAAAGPSLSIVRMTKPIPGGSDGSWAVIVSSGLETSSPSQARGASFWRSGFSPACKNAGMKKQAMSGRYFMVRKRWSA